MEGAGEEREIVIRELGGERRNMVDHQLRQAGIADERVLGAMEAMPRHAFLDASQWDEAYQPRAVPIGQGQTISQPFMVALMTERLEVAGGENVLEIGTGSGYQAAVLALMGARVVTIERIPELAHRARHALLGLGLGEVDVVVGDGSSAAPLRGRFDRIVVTAAAPALPPSLLDHLADPGILVCPVGDRDLQVLEIVRREGGRDRVERSCACRFVPLLGEEGFA